MFLEFVLVGFGCGLVLYRTQIGHELPALRFGESGPGWHSMAKVALAQEPLEVSVGGGFDSVGAKSRLFMAVAHRVRFMTLPAVFLVDQRSGRDGFRPGSQRIRAVMIFRGNLAPARGGCGA